MDVFKFHEVMGDLESSILTIPNVTMALARFAHEYELTNDRTVNYGIFKDVRKVYSSYRTSDNTNKN